VKVRAERVITPQGSFFARPELIYYEREDVSGPKLSTFSVSPTPHPENLRMLLASALGIRAEVRKRRTVYVVGQTRIHFDEVEGLGNYVELEFMLRPDQDCEEGVVTVAGLLRQLNVSDADLVERAYVDLLPC
jgi:adenylate cyclase class IV